MKLSMLTVTDQTAPLPELPIAGAGCALHSAHRMDRFSLLLGEDAAPVNGSAVPAHRGN